MNDKGRKNTYIKHEFEDGEIKDVRETSKIFKHRKNEDTVNITEPITAPTIIKISVSSTLMLTFYK